MKHLIRKVIRRVPFARNLLLSNTSSKIPHGLKGVQKVGHREYVGGKWEEIGELQYNFLVAHGLQPKHYLIDIACGSLRAGVHLIPYLDPGHYLGVDKERKLINKGIMEEIKPEMYNEKKPQFVVSDEFNFDGFENHPDYAIAQSLFTHLPPPGIELCLAKLACFIRDEGVFFATFFETENKAANPSQPHDHEAFRYTRQQMEDFGIKNGWTAEYVGDWNHPRGQVMMKYRPE